MNKIIKFIIKPISQTEPCLPSLNQYITQCRANRFGANAWKHKYQDIIAKQILSQCENFCIDTPFILNLEICESSKRRDKDNVESMAKKLILDTLQEYKYVSNDKLYEGGNTKFQYNKNDSYIIVTIERS